MSETTELTLTVPEMSCGHCVAAVDAAVRGVEGVADVSVDLDAKLVAVSGAGVAAAQVEQAIREAGYEPERR